MIVLTAMRVQSQLVSMMRLLQVVCVTGLAVGASCAQVTAPQPLLDTPTPLAMPPRPAPAPGSIEAGKQELALKNFAGAKKIFQANVKEHPESVEAQLGLADAELGLHEYEPAELDYRHVVAQQPELWQAHKNLVIVEAALGRWEEFERERALLRGARERGAAGISARESDVIDSFTVKGQRWIVREYFEPAGRSLTRYNFEHFSPEGKAVEYVSLESNAAAKTVVPGGAVVVGAESAKVNAASEFALNWYTGKGHGTIAKYPAEEPKYEVVRAAVMGWLRR